MSRNHCLVSTDHEDGWACNSSLIRDNTVLVNQDSVSLARNTTWDGGSVAVAALASWGELVTQSSWECSVQGLALCVEASGWAELDGGALHEHGHGVDWGQEWGDLDGDLWVAAWAADEVAGGGRVGGAWAQRDVEDVWEWADVALGAEVAGVAGLDGEDGGGVSESSLGGDEWSGTLVGGSTEGLKDGGLAEETSRVGDWEGVDALLDSLASKGGGEEVNVVLLVAGDGLETLVEVWGNTEGLEVGGGEVGETLLVEYVLQMLKGESEVQNVGIGDTGGGAGGIEVVELAVAITLGISKTGAGVVVVAAVGAVVTTAWCLVSRGWSAGLLGSVGVTGGVVDHVGRDSGGGTVLAAEDVQRTGRDGGSARNGAQGEGILHYERK